MAVRERKWQMSKMYHKRHEDVVVVYTAQSGSFTGGYIVLQEMFRVIKEFGHFHDFERMMKQVKMV